MNVTISPIMDPNNRILNSLKNFLKLIKGYTSLDVNNNTSSLWNNNSICYAHFMLSKNNTLAYEHHF